MGECEIKNVSAFFIDTVARSDKSDYMASNGMTISISAEY